MAGLLIVLIILGCAGYQYQKGTLVKSFATIVTSVCASIVAFGYFELLATVFINRDIVVPWAQSLSFVLLFVLAFAVIQTITAQLSPRRPIDLGFLPERIGRVACGAFSGLIISGTLLAALAMAPLPNKYPYQRFDTTRPDPENPNKVLFNADGFATGWFGMVSSGSFSGKRSFAALHPDFLDQVFLNRHSIAEDIPAITTSQAIEVPKKNAAWLAAATLKYSKDLNKPVEHRSGHNLTIVRVGIKKKMVGEAGTFTLSQLRLVCKHKNDSNRLAGKAKNIYPIGYLTTANLLQRKQLNDRISLRRSDFDGSVKWTDFAFYVPNDFLPVLVEFKQNSIAVVPPLSSGRAGKN